MTLETGPFTPRTVRRIVSVCVTSLLLGAIITAFGGDMTTPTTAGPGVFSPSATGHMALRRILQRLDIPVVASRSDSGARAATSGVLMLVEPSDMETLPDDVGDARTVLVVLPKWAGSPHDQFPRWLRDAGPVDAGIPNHVLATLNIGAEVLRPPSESIEWTSPWSATPKLRSPQFLPLDAGTPLVHGPEGSLVTEFPHPSGSPSRLLVLTDPDLIATHGLDQGDNALLAVQLIDSLRGEGGAVILDETAHGFRLAPSFWRSLLGFPLVLLFLHGLALAGLIAWSGNRRFGAPDPVLPEMPPGKLGLIANTADLLHAAGHSGAVLDRLSRIVVRDVAEALHVTATPGTPEFMATLARLETSRKVENGIADLQKQVRGVAFSMKARERDIVAVARGLGRWREEMLRGH